ncbi:MAG: hypothetical protein ACR2OY_00120 [Boseongicola sp.]
MTKIPPKPRVKLSRLRDIGWKLWDPIGLLPSTGKWDDASSQSFADEYDQYLISAATQLQGGAPHEQVVEYLFQIESKHMGLGENASAHERAAAVVDAILADETLWSWPDEQGRFA